MYLILLEKVIKMNLHWCIKEKIKSLQLKLREK